MVKGYAQQEGIDFNKTFYSIAHFEIVRIVLVLVAELHLHVFQNMM